MAYREFTPEDLEKIFDIYRNAPLNFEGKPSLSHTARIARIERATVKSLRDKHGWEEKRLQGLERVQDRLDKKRDNEDVKRVQTYQQLENAGINYHGGRIKSDKLKITIGELISLSKHVQVLSGNPDSHQRNSGEIDLRIRCNSKAERGELTDELLRNLQDLKAEDEKGREDEKQDTG